MAILQNLVSTAQRRMTAAGRAFDRARILYREKGARQLFATVGGSVGRRLGLSIGKDAEYLRQRAQVDRQFDQQRGTDTGGVQNLFALTVAGDNALHGGTHIAVDPAEFADGMAALGIDPSTFTFVDLGSGKGRAVLLAAECGFRQVIGVEFALELHQVALANVAAFSAAHPALAAHIRLVHADATTFITPSTPAIIFLFNPFDAVICRQVAENILNSWKACPRPIQIFYMNPVELDTWLEAGWRLRRRAQPYALLEPPEPRRDEVRA